MAEDVDKVCARIIIKKQFDPFMGGKTKRAMLSESDCVGSADGSVS